MNNNNIISNNTHNGKKVPLLVYIPRELDEKFRKFIALKHQKAEKGLISYEVESAISSHISVHNIQQSTHSVGNCENHFFKIEQLKQGIIQYLKSKYHYENPRIIPENHLDEAIACLQGTDPRTIKKWKSLLERFDYLKRTGIHGFEIK